ncbi:hypothetical protein E2C01_070917 [Portunus trituberculatus]|uniref:Uncharacterized protein n=1 Tax=Portunus trituberculatus TaxID=210409 RepID=A0A5B7HYM3_PORTR|nr:hypothetical protein [Portunus trituberculatus]
MGSLYRVRIYADIHHTWDETSGGCQPEIGLRSPSHGAAAPSGAPLAEVWLSKSDGLPAAALLQKLVSHLLLFRRYPSVFFSFFLYLLLLYRFFFMIFQFFACLVFFHFSLILLFLVSSS